MSQASISQNRSWTAADIPSQAGRLALITGGNSGIGFHTALELARRGAMLLLPARSEAKAAEAANRIRQQVPSASIVTELLDLADLGSVRAFAQRVLTRFPGPSIDLLINNAGVMALPTRELTADGFERQIATNYLGPFALTALLFPAIKPQPGSRVVTLSSSLAADGKLDWSNLQSERSYKPFLGAYATTKLADLFFALELDRRLDQAGSPIRSTAAHPGFAVTNLQADHLSTGLKLFTGLLKPFFSQDAAHGALPTLFAATAPLPTAERYFGPDGLGALKGNPVAVKVPAKAQDLEAARRLWAESERLTQTPFALP